MPPTTRTYVGYPRRRAESPPKHRHQSSRIKMLDSKRDDVAPRPVGMGRGAHRRMIPPHSHTHTLHTKGRRHASGGRAQAKVHGLNLRRSDLPCVGPAGRSPLRDFHAFLEVRERTEVAALGDQTAIATSTRRSAQENNPADDASTKHVAIERVARRRGGLRRDATHDSDLRRLPPTTSSLLICSRILLPRRLRRQGLSGGAPSSRPRQTDRRRFQRLLPVTAASRAPHPYSKKLTSLTIGAWGSWLSVV